MTYQRLVSVVNEVGKTSCFSKKISFQFLTNTVTALPHQIQLNWRD